MGDEVDQVSYGESGYHTFETEAEAKHEAREHYRRHLLSCIRGRVRENKSLRWRIALLLLLCIAAACGLASLPVAQNIGGPWRGALAVMAMWPVYVWRLRAFARAESRHLELSGHWDSLITHDQLGEQDDRNMSEKIDRIVKKVWEGGRNQHGDRGDPQANLLAFVVLTIATLGTWTIWDLLRMAPSLVAEIIVDGVLVPAHPALGDRMPSYPWWKNAFASTALHFFAIAMCVTGLFAVGMAIPVIRAEHGGT
jgi:Flp pilus assembly protein TadB